MDNTSDEDKPTERALQSAVPLTLEALHELEKQGWDLICQKEPGEEPGINGWLYEWERRPGWQTRTLTSDEIKQLPGASDDDLQGPFQKPTDEPRGNEEN